MAGNGASEADLKYRREEYLSRINRVIDYIETHLDGDLSLKRLADVAHFSPYHFHRIFRAIVGETLSRFIQRVRVEKAAGQLVSNPKKSITEIALDCGFSGSAAFAKVFKETFGMSASQWRSKIGKIDRKVGETVHNIGQDFHAFSYYIDGKTHYPVWRINMEGQLESKIEVREMPAWNVAYVRHIGPYAGQVGVFEKIFGTLMGWAGPRGLLRFPETKVLSVYHDDPNVTEEEKLRVSACITVPEGTKGKGEVGNMTIPGGQFAVAHFEIGADQYQQAWDLLMGGWLPGSGYQCDDRLCYEMMLNDPHQHPEGRHIVEICVPVKPL